MKTPSDVFNSMQVILAHLNDLKTHFAITAPSPSIPPAFQTTPKDLYHKTDELLRVLKDVAERLKLGQIEIPPTPADVEPRDIYANTNRVIHYLQLVKRRLGVSDRTKPQRATVRVSPSHIIVEAERALQEFKRVREAL